MAADETRWLDDDEQDAWRPLASVLLTLPAALDAQLQRQSKLTFYEYVVLAGLEQAGSDGYRMTDLAAVTSGALSRLSQVVTRMEERQWVARTPDPLDGRATRVVLRPAGAKQLKAAAPGHLETVRRFVFDELTPTQVQQLRRVMQKISGTLSGPDSPAPAPAREAPRAAKGPGARTRPR
ncbi:MAG: MarR family transcriptional regulator [Acidimicrobiales bacterium]